MIAGKTLSPNLIFLLLFLPLNYVFFVREAGTILLTCACKNHLFLTKCFCGFDNLGSPLGNSCGIIFRFFTGSLKRGIKLQNLWWLHLRTPESLGFVLRAFGRTWSSRLCDDALSRHHGSLGPLSWAFILSLDR